MERRQPKGEALQFMQMQWALAHALDVRSKRTARTLGVTGPQRLVRRKLVVRRVDSGDRRASDSL